MQLTHSEKKWGVFMYFKSKNKTAIRSQHIISDALFSLMKRKPFQQITVTEICEEAAIGRKTFYRNFELREDVIDFQLDLMCEDYKKELIPLPLEQYLYHHFAYIQKNADYFIVLYKNGLCISALVSKERNSDSPGQSGKELVGGVPTVKAEAVFIQVALEVHTPAVIGSRQKCFQIA